MIRVIPTSQVATYWPKVLPLLQPAIDRGQRAKADKVFQWLLRGDYQLWVAGNSQEINGAATTAITEYPGSKWLTIVHCGGTGLPTWLNDGIETLTSWAIGNGCDGIEGFGREEWGRVLPDAEIVGTAFQIRVMPERRAAQ